MAKTEDMEQWANEGTMALRVCANLSVLALVAVIAVAAPSPEPADGTAAPTTNTVAAPFEYFPAQYDLNAAESAEAAPTF